MNTIAYECGVARLGEGPTVPLAELDVREHGGGLGWSGWGRIREADRGAAPDLFARAQAHGLVPGEPVVVTLSPVGRGPRRTWPSVLTDLVVRSDADALSGVFVRFADPLTHLGGRQLYAVFADGTPGEILAGSLARAAGVTADIGSLRVAHPLLPTLDIRERGGGTGDSIPYAIAGGETLIAFVRGVLAGTGRRLSVRGLASGEIRMDLIDAAEEPARPEDEALELVRSFGERTAPGTLVVRGLTADRGPDADSASDVAERSDPFPGLTGLQTEITSEGIRVLGSGGLPAENREAKGAEISRPGRWVVRAHAGTEEPGLYAGGRVALTDGAVAGTRKWRVLAVTHRLEHRGYANECALVAMTHHSVAADELVQKSGEESQLQEHGWCRGAVPDSHGPSPRILTGTVGEEGTRDGTVARIGAGGRLPVRLACDPGPVVRLPFVAPAAGGVHGFAPACSSGDRVRVRVHRPFRAEVRGAIWSEALAPDEELRRSALAVRAASDLGMAFHPADRVPELAR